MATALATTELLGAMNTRRDSCEYAHGFVTVLTGNVQRRLSHGVLHVHIGHVLDQIMEELRPPVHSQPVNLWRRVRRRSQGSNTDA